jgi:YggT family protein
MFILGNLIGTIAKVLDIVLNLYMWIIIIRAIISWVNPDPYNPIIQFLYQVTEPVLSPIRRIIPTYTTGIDFSPIIVFLLIIFLQNFLVSTLTQMAVRLH